MSGLVNRGGFVMGLLAGAFALLPAAQAAVTISAAQTKNMSCASGVCTPTAKNAVLNAGDLAGLLAGGNVAVNTGTGHLARQVGDIVVAAGFDWTSASSLTLDAYDSITVDQPVADNGAGAVTLTTNDGGSGGVLYFGAKGSLSFAGTANSLTIDGAAYTLENSVHALAAAVAANTSGNFALSANYDAAQDGTYTQSPIDGLLGGTVQGLGNTISHLSISSSGKGAAQYKGPELGLIGSLYFEGRPSGTVNGLVLKGLSIRCTGSRGCRAGGITYEAGNLFNDTVSGTFEGENSSFGGLVFASIDGSIIRSNAHVTIRERGAKHGWGVVGGLVALNDGTIEMSRASGSVSGALAVGGLAGEDAGMIDQSFSTATVTGSDGAHVHVGGLIGLSDHEDILVSNSYATGAVSGGSSAAVGGFIGGVNSPIEYSYSTGAPTGGAGGAVGGFAGGTSGDFFTDSYWDTTTSGTDEGTGSGNVTGLSGLTTAQLQAGLPAGFDPGIWAEKPKFNGGLPYLIANPPN